MINTTKSLIIHSLFCVTASLMAINASAESGLTGYSCTVQNHVSSVDVNNGAITTSDAYKGMTFEFSTLTGRIRGEMGSLIFDSRPVYEGDPNARIERFGALTINRYTDDRGTSVNYFYLLGEEKTRPGYGRVAKNTYNDRNFYLFKNGTPFSGTCTPLFGGTW